MFDLEQDHRQFAAVRLHQFVLFAQGSKQPQQHTPRLAAAILLILAQDIQQAIHGGGQIAVQRQAQGILEGGFQRFLAERRAAFGAAQRLYQRAHRLCGNEFLAGWETCQGAGGFIQAALHHLAAQQAQQRRGETGRFFQELVKGFFGLSPVLGNNLTLPLFQQQVGLAGGQRSQELAAGAVRAVRPQTLTLPHHRGRL